MCIFVCVHVCVHVCIHPIERRNIIWVINTVGSALLIHGAYWKPLSVSFFDIFVSDDTRRASVPVKLKRRKTHQAALMAAGQLERPLDTPNAN